MTGRGTLQQIGFDTPSTATLALLCGVFGTATLVGTADTVRKLFMRKMTAQDIARWGAKMGIIADKCMLTCGTLLPTAVRCRSRHVGQRVPC